MERVNRLITIDLDINEKLKKIAKEDKRSVNSLIEIALNEYINYLEYLNTCVGVDKPTS